MALEIRRRDVPLAFMALMKLAEIGFKQDYTRSKKLARNIREVRLLNEEIDEEREILNKAFAKYDEEGKMVKSSLGADASGNQAYRVVFEDEVKAQEGFRRVMDGVVELTEAEAFTDADLKVLRKEPDGGLLEALGPFAPMGGYKVNSGRARADVLKLAGVITPEE
jgi:hypothetical protein